MCCRAETCRISLCSLKLELIQEGEILVQRGGPWKWHSRLNGEIERRLDHAGVSIPGEITRRLSCVHILRLDEE